MTRNVIVTGGSRGLGLATATTLLNAGFQVIAIARKDTAELAAAREAGSLHFVPFDLSEVSGIAGMVKAVRKQFGPIYGLVNNAAVSIEAILSTMADEKIEQLIRLNTLAPLVLTKYVVRSMMASGGGRIVNIASIIASTGYSGLSVYGATKASLIGFTKSLAREVGPAGINVNAVAPGFIATEMTKQMSNEQRDKIARRSALKRLAGAEDVAGTVEFLMSEKAKNITGTVLTVDAGNTA